MEIENMRQTVYLILTDGLFTLKNPPNHETDPYLFEPFALYIAENAYIAG